MSGAPSLVHEGSERWPQGLAPGGGPREPD